MSMWGSFKGALRAAGLYPALRACYRRISPAEQRERAVTARFFGELIKPGDLCFDIGANVGKTSEAMLDGGATVVALEPNQLCGEVLNWQFGRDPRFRLVSKAVGDEPGEATLHFTGTQSTASLRDDWAAANRDSQTVEVTTLDALIAQFGRPALCKIDVEGFEVQVFKGLSQPIPLIYFEVRQSEAARARESLSRLASVGEITSINMSNMLHERWLFDEFLSLEEFLDRFETKLFGARNILVKMACP